MTGGDAAPVGVLMVAIGGYGCHYLRTLVDDVGPARARLAGVVDPEARQSPAWPIVERLGVPVYATVEEFYRAGHHADLAVIASPIQWHAPQACVALEHGADVLCDKPLAATVQEADAVIDARDRSGRWMLLGYQWSFSAAIRALKRDILGGLFGRPVRFRTLCCWPRDLAYYRRNDWAGRLRDARDARWVLDSPANNAMAHFLHNLLFLAGSEAGAAARPRVVQAETYRAFPIDSCDTVACRVITEHRLEILFCASHATRSPIEPRFRLDFEDGRVSFGEDGPTIVARDHKGNSKDYGAPDDTPQFQKLFDAIEAAGRSVAGVCGPEAASAQTLAINGIHESVAASAPFPPSLVVNDTRAGRLFVDDLDDVLRRCYESARLPGEAGVAWARPGRPVDLNGYRWFPGGQRP
jgi:predicted dehydrogenase